MKDEALALLTDVSLSSPVSLHLGHISPTLGAPAFDFNFLLHTHYSAAFFLELGGGDEDEGMVWAGKKKVKDLNRL